MTIDKDIQRMGVELECYYDDYDSYDCCNEPYCHCYIENADISSNLEACSDGSLCEGGIEYKFSRPFTIAESEIVCDELHRLALTHSHGVNNINDIPEDSRNTSRSKFKSNSGASGLHIHLELPENYTIVDHIKLNEKGLTDIDEIHKLAGRSNNYFAASPEITLDHIERCINKSIRANDCEDVAETSNYLVDDRYRGIVNISYHGTVEYRWGSSAIMCSKSDWNNYLNKILELHSTFNYEKEMIFRKWRIRDISPESAKYRRCLKVWDKNTDVFLGKARFYIGS